MAEPLPQLHVSLTISAVCAYLTPLYGSKQMDVVYSPRANLHNSSLFWDWTSALTVDPLA